MEFVQQTAFIVVDPVSTGRVLAAKAISRGYNVIALWTQGSVYCQSLLGECDPMPFVGQVREEVGDSIDDIMNKIQALPYKVVACTVGCESGVEMNDIISNRLNVKSNGEEMSEPRRDKWAMAERIRECGLRAVKQAVVTSMDEITDFVTKEGLRKWILKPRRSAATDGVFMCTTLEDSREKFENILSRKTIFGENNTDALIQEYLTGTEYVVDTVSCDGVHKVVAFWEYDKRTVHSSPFVYYGMHLFQTEDRKKEEMLSEYVFGCLDALTITCGACHAEVIWLEDEAVPVLVEVGTRPHGAGGNFPALCDPVIGYNQLDVLLDSMMDPPAFYQIPSLPRTHVGHAIQYFFVTYEDGTFESMDLSPLDSLQSYVGVDMHKKIGEDVIRTVDLVGATGVVRLVHADKSLVLRESDQIRAIERGMFTIRSKKPIPDVTLDELVPVLLTH